MSDRGNTTDTAVQGHREISRDAAAIRAGQQGLLFDDSAMESLPEVGYRGPVAAGVVGITYRQLDYWARTSLVLPTVRPATGSGTSRLYGFRDILELKIVKRLLDTGVSLQQIRTAIEHLRARGTTDLTQVTLMSDGVSVYECTSPDEVIDLLAGGQGVFGIAIGRVWQEIEGSLSQLPSDQSEYAVSDAEVSESSMAGQGNDELSMRRRARVVGE
jgi:DNA-binding transcriptional MerR regulator